MTDLNLQEIANRSARVRFRACEPDTDHEAYELARNAQQLLTEVERLRAEMETLRPVADAARRAVATDGVDEWNELVDVINAEAIDAAGGGA